MQEGICQENCCLALMMRSKMFIRFKFSQLLVLTGYLQTLYCNQKKFSHFDFLLGLCSWNIMMKMAKSFIHSYGWLELSDLITSMNNLRKMLVFSYFLKKISQGHILKYFMSMLWLYWTLKPVWGNGYDGLYFNASLPGDQFAVSSLVWLFSSLYVPFYEAQ